MENEFLLLTNIVGSYFNFVSLVWFNHSRPVNFEFYLLSFPFVGLVLEAGNKSDTSRSDRAQYENTSQRRWEFNSHIHTARNSWMLSCFTLKRHRVHTKLTNCNRPNSSQFMYCSNWSCCKVAHSPSACRALNNVSRSIQTAIDRQSYLNDHYTSSKSI